MPFDPYRRANPSVLDIAPYVPGKSLEEAMEESGRDDVIKLASNENPLGASPAAVAAIRDALDLSHRYVESSTRQVRERLASLLHLTPEHLIAGNGSDALLLAAAMAFLHADDEVIVPEVTFSMYEIVARIMGARVVRSAMDGMAIDVDAILDKVTPATKAVFLCNPNNPTGTLIDERRFADLVAALPDDVLLIHDEAYADFADPALRPDTMGRVRDGVTNLLVTRTFSKSHGLAGIRFGFACGDPRVIDLLHRVRPPFDLSVTAQAAGVAAADDREFLQRTLQVNRDGKAQLTAGFDALGLPFVPTHTNFIMVRLGERASTVADDLLQRGLVVRCWTRPAALAGWLRVTVGTEPENRSLLAGLADVLASHGP